MTITFGTSCHCCECQGKTCLKNHPGHFHWDSAPKLTGEVAQAAGRRADRPDPAPRRA